MTMPKEKESYTYEDYLNWPETERFEIIDGEAYALATPSRYHQELLGELHLIIGSYLKGKDCKVYLAPFDVRLDVGNGKDPVVWPDISVICDKDKLGL